MSSNIFFLELISWRIFFKDQGQEESTPRVVGGKKNNKAWWHQGTTTLLTSSVIISALLGCLGNLHNTILTRSLQLSITIGMVFSVFLLYFLSLSLSGFLSLIVFYVYLAKQKKIDFILYLPFLFNKYEGGK